MRDGMRSSFKLVLGLTLSLTSVVSSQAAFIDFEDVVACACYTAPTDVSTHYSALGVTFSVAAPAGPIGVATGFGTPSPNVFVANQHQSNDLGDLRLSFSIPVDLVTFDFFPFFEDHSSAHVLVYDSGNNLLGTFNFAEGDVTAKIDTGPNLIDHLFIAALSTPPQGPVVFDNFLIDNLSFGVSAVAEPSTWAMMILGFAALASWRIVGS